MKTQLLNFYNLRHKLQKYKLREVSVGLFSELGFLKIDNIGVKDGRQGQGIGRATWRVEILSLRDSKDADSG
jgi:hypothetical protein